MSWKSETTSEDLQQWANKLHIRLNFIGFKDKLKHIKPGAYIINLQNSNQGSGTHWVGMYLSIDQHAYYFDSFGASPPEEVLKVMKYWTNNVKHIHINPYDIQNINGGFCGEYVIDFLVNITRNPTLNGFRHFLHKYKLFRLQKNKDIYI